MGWIQNPDDPGQRWFNNETGEVSADATNPGGGQQPLPFSQKFGGELQAAFNAAAAKAGLSPDDPIFQQAFAKWNNQVGGMQTGTNPWDVYNGVLNATGNPQLASQVIQPNDPRYQQGAATGVDRDAQLKAMNSKFDSEWNSDMMKGIALFAAAPTLGLATGAFGGGGLSALGGGSGGLTAGLDSGLAGISDAIAGGYGSTSAAAAAAAAEAAAGGTSPLLTAGGGSGLGSAGTYAGNAALDGVNSTLGLGGGFDAEIAALTNAPGVASSAAQLGGLCSTSAGLTLGSNLAAISPGAAGIGGGFDADIASQGFNPGVANSAAQLGGVGSTAAGLNLGTGVATTAASTVAKSALSKLLDGTATPDDWMKLLGQAAPGIAGAFGASQQADALKDLNSQYMGFGAPSRGRYEQSMTAGFDPLSIPGYKGAVDTASESLLRKLSATGGNPYGNPGGMIEANKAIISGTALPAIQNYQNQNAAAGGLSQLAGAAPGIAQQAIGSQGGVLSSLGSAAGSVFNPPQTTDQSFQTVANMLKKLGLGSGTTASSLA